MVTCDTKIKYANAFIGIMTIHQFPQYQMNFDAISRLINPTMKRHAVMYPKQEERLFYEPSIGAAVAIDKPYPAFSSEYYNTLHTDKRLMHYIFFHALKQSLAFIQAEELLRGPYTEGDVVEHTITIQMEAVYYG